MASNDLRYFVREGNRTTGPYNLADLINLQRKGKLARFVRLSTDRVTWFGLESVPELAGTVARGQESWEEQVDYGQALANTAEETTWYYGQDGESLGPVPTSQLRVMLAHGQLAPDTLVWHSGLADWMSADTVPDLTPAPYDFPQQPEDHYAEGPYEYPDVSPGPSGSGTSVAVGVALGLAALALITLGAVAIYLLRPQTQPANDDEPAVERPTAEEDLPAPAPKGEAEEKSSM